MIYLVGSWHLCSCCGATGSDHFQICGYFTDKTKAAEYAEKHGEGLFEVEDGEEWAIPHELICAVRNRKS